MEREFNAGQTHCSMYPSIFNRLRAIARYWSEIATFSYPLAFNAPVGGVLIGIPGKSFVLRKLESWGYQAVKTVLRYVKPFRHNTSVWRTDGRTDVQPIAMTCAVWLTHVKIKCEDNDVHAFHHKDSIGRVSIISASSADTIRTSVCASVLARLHVSRVSTNYPYACVSSICHNATWQCTIKPECSSGLGSIHCPHNQIYKHHDSSSCTLTCATYDDGCSAYLSPYDACGCPANTVMSANVCSLLYCLLFPLIIY